MFRSICQRILGAFKTNGRRKAPRRVYPRRLSVESLESRKLLTVTTLTLNSISDGNFAAPTLAKDAYQVAPNLSSPWQFSGDAGISADNSGFTNGNPNAPKGTQVAFIKDNASISQTVYLEAGVYDLSCIAAQRANYQTQNQEIEVLVDNVEAGLIVPQSNTNPPGEPVAHAYVAFDSWNFTVQTTGTHTVEFLGLSPSGADSTAFIDEVAITPAVDSMVDGGFETPALPANDFQTDATGSAWQFSGTAGVARNGSAFVTNWTEAQNAPAGAQVAYIQDTGSMSQTVYLDAGTYQVSFLAAQRAIYQASYQEIEVLVDTVPEGTINPVNTTYSSYQSSTFTVATGVHTVEFLGLDPQQGDNTAFIDQVAISANAVNDGSFETPALVPNAEQVAPAGSPWQFSGNAGVSRNASSITLGNPKAPDGAQVGFIEGSASMSQSIDLDANTYNLSFLAAQGAKNASQTEEIEVLLDGTQVIGLITPLDTTYRLYQTANFTVAAGVHSIELLGVNPRGGNNAVLIDEVAVTAAEDEIVDGGFESPVLASNSFQTAPSDTPWQFSGSAGVSTNNSGVTSGNDSAPQGVQVGFIMNNGSMSQTVDLDANTYNISFLACQRVTDQSQSQQIEVLIENTQTNAITQVGLITPTNSTTFAVPPYTLYQTSNFTVAAGTYTIQLVGMSHPSGSGESTALIDDVKLATVENTFTDGGFETPVLAADTYQIAPSGSGWQFSGIAGVSDNLSGFTVVTNGTCYAPEGNQVAFIKDTGSMSQSVYFEAGAYSISFLATQRIDYQTQNQQIEVLIDGTQVVASITPAVSTSPNSTASNSIYTYTAYQTANFTVTAGMHTIEFLGMAPTTADSTAFIDDATISTGCTISDGDFEEPVLATHADQFAPSGTAWQFTGAAGVSTDAADDKSGFTVGNPIAPDGDQVAFIKDTGSISQSVYLAPGVYNLSFMAAQRNLYQSQEQSLNILLDGNLVGSATPSSPASGIYPAGTTFGSYQTSNFTITTAGWYTITFAGLSPTTADSTAFIDDVQLNS
jgi:hypothetical protein